MQSLGARDTVDDEDKGDGGSEKRGLGEGESDRSGHESSVAGAVKSRGKGGLADPESGSEAPVSTRTSDKTSPSPPEHPLQKAITSFDMALGELNQLVHLIDLARAGEFMALERVTPKGEDPAKAILDQSVNEILTIVRRNLSTVDHVDYFGWGQQTDISGPSVVCILPPVIHPKATCPTPLPTGETRIGPIHVSDVRVEDVLAMQ